jgi:hypothetical protein
MWRLLLCRLGLTVCFGHFQTGARAGSVTKMFNNTLVVDKNDVKLKCSATSVTDVIKWTIFNTRTPDVITGCNNAVNGLLFTCNGSESSLSLTANFPHSGVYACGVDGDMYASAAALIVLSTYTISYHANLSGY